MAYYYLNGKIIPATKATVSINDIGLLRGYGIFDFLRTYNGRPFLMREHLDRFKKSAKALGLNVPVSPKKLEEIIGELIKKNHFHESTVRLVLTGGIMSDGLKFNPRKPTLAVIVDEAHELPFNVYRKGVSLMTYEHQRNLAEAKTLNYITAVRLQPEREKRGAFEILYTSKGRILETTTSNILAFMGNVLIAPKKDILIGTTRNFVLQLAKQLGFKIIERDLRKLEIPKLAEVLLTASNKGIIPVVKIDKIRIGNGKPGELTQLLMAQYKKITRSN